MTDRMASLVAAGSLRDLGQPAHVTGDDREIDDGDADHGSHGHHGKPPRHGEKALLGRPDGVLREGVQDDRAFTGERHVQCNEKPVYGCPVDQVEGAVQRKPVNDEVERRPDHPRPQTQREIEQKLPLGLQHLIGRGHHPFFQKAPQKDDRRKRRQDDGPQAHGGQFRHKRSDLASVNGQDDDGQQVVSEDTHGQAPFGLRCNVGTRAKGDDFAKSPISALRFMSLSLRRTISTPRSARFARLELGLFTKSSRRVTFCEIIKGVWLLL